MIRGMTAPSFMDLALKTAENAGKSGEVPIGCVIVRDSEVIATAGNRTLTDRDPTAHAEILAIRQAAETIGTERLVDCDLYVTLEPCTMCAGANFVRPHSPALLRRGGPERRRGGFRCAILRFPNLPSCAGGLFGGRRARVGGHAAGVLQAAAVKKRPQRFPGRLRIFLRQKMPGIDRRAGDVGRPHLPGVERGRGGARNPRVAPQRQHRIVILLPASRSVLSISKSA